jgi:DUF971 family protein
MTPLQPIDLKLSESGALVIVWNDDLVQEISPRNLRKACPCARCKADAMQPQQPQQPKGALNVLTSAQARPLSIHRMTPVGNYAYAVEFSDGHHSGIFTLEYLRQIGDEAARQRSAR